MIYFDIQYLELVLVLAQTDNDTNRQATSRSITRKSQDVPKRRRLFYLYYVGFFCLYWTAYKITYVIADLLSVFQTGSPVSLMETQTNCDLIVWTVLFVYSKPDISCSFSGL